MHKTVVLIILDGWGMKEPAADNAISQANPHFFNTLWREKPHALLTSWGESVGLLPNMVGNSEVGHFTIGAGAIIPQQIQRISQAIADQTFFKDLKLHELARTNHTIHLVGLISSGTVHAYLQHLKALYDFFTACGCTVIIHAFSDGRDSGIRDALLLIQNFPAKLLGAIKTLCGRAYGMDRNKNWDKTNIAFNLIVNGIGHETTSFETSLEGYYHAGITDEFIPPLKCKSYKGIEPHDLLFFFNFREDRLRQLAGLCAQENIQCASLVEFEDKRLAAIPYLYHKIRCTETLSDDIANRALTQVHIAETEKAAHVTYFINGGRESTREGESFHIVPSLQVESYTQAPHMSAAAITAYACEVIGSVDVVIVNFANADMVGHTGSLSGTIEAIQFLDTQLAAIAAAVEKVNGHLFITSDHGNAEVMINQETGLMDTEHNKNPSPLLYSGDAQLAIEEAKTLADIKRLILQAVDYAQEEQLNASRTTKY
jgi:2,3-bisphosphoglycerate-independent phosphoglycerate mutase